VEQSLGLEILVVCEVRHILGEFNDSYISIVISILLPLEARHSGLGGSKATLRPIRAGQTTALISGIHHPETYHSLIAGATVTEVQFGQLFSCTYRRFFETRPL